MKRSTMTRPRTARDAAERARARYKSDVATTGLRIQARGGRQVSILAEAQSDPPSAETSSSGQLVDLIRANTALLREAYHSPDIESFAESLGSATQAAIAVFDPLLQPLAMYDPEGSMAQFGWMRTRDRLPDLVTAAAEGHCSVPRTSSPKSRYPAHVIAPIRSGDSVQAYLVMATWAFDVIESASGHMTEQTATIAAVVLNKSTFLGTVDDNVESAAIEALASDDSSARRTFQLLRRSLRVSSTSTYQVVVFSPRHRAASGSAEGDDPAVAAVRDGVYTTVLEPLRRTFHSAAVGHHDDQLIVIHPRPGRSPGTVGQLVDFVVKYARSRVFPLDLAAGVSSTGQGSDLHALLQQARQARATANLLRLDDEMVEFEKLGLNVLFSSLSDTATLETYVDHVLGPLLEYDEEHSTDLVMTLAAYLRHAGSQQAAARELHVHSNTVNYRLARVREFVPLTTHAERLAVEVAVHIHETLHRGIARDSA